MVKYIFLLITLPLFIFGQEQITNITSNGVYRTTYINSKIGFTKIKDTLYMLEEKESLNIYKWKNNSWILMNDIKGIENRHQINYQIFPNRSGFDIKNGLYYRFFTNALQMIDVANAKLISQHDIADYGIVSMVPIGVDKEKLYFREHKNQIITYYTFDVSSDILDTLFLPGNHLNYVMKDKVITRVQSDGSIYFLNTEIQRDSVFQFSVSVIKFLNYSVEDSTFNFLQIGGSIVKIKKNLEVTTLKSTFGDFDSSNSLYVNGNKLIAIMNFGSHEGRQDSVTIFDMLTWTVDLAFRTKPLRDFARYIDFIETEDNIKGHSIFGFYGYDSGDGLNEGLYYIIDHRNNIATDITDISRVSNYSPGIFNDALYFVGNNSSFWGNYSYLVRFDLVNKDIKKIQIYGDYYTEYINMGYDTNDELHFAANSIDEDPALWKIGPDDNITKVQSLDFSENLGVNYIFNIFSEHDKIYFNNLIGLYSMLDSGKLEIPFGYDHKLFQYDPVIQIASYENKIAIPEFFEKKFKVKIINTNTGTLDSVIDDRFEIYDDFVIAGPFIFYDQKTEPFGKYAYNIKTNSFLDYSTLPYLYSSLLHTGDTRAVFEVPDWLSGLKSTIYLLDYETGNISDLGIELSDYADIIAGYDNSFYFVEDSSNKARIRLLKKNGELTTVYDGPGTFYRGFSYARDKNNPVSVFSIYDNNNKQCHIITSDLNQTSSFTIPHIYTYNDKNCLRNVHDNSFIIGSKKTEGWDYSLYDAHAPLIKIEENNDKKLLFSDLQDSMALLMFYGEDSTITIVTYDRISQTKSSFLIPGFPCFYQNIVRGIWLNQRKYLMTGYCNGEFEPWILDTKQEELKLLSDLNPGKNSSYPDNLLRFGDWVYFTAYVKNSNKQWFRILAKSDPTYIEPVGQASQKLKMFPSPASINITISGDYEDILIYSPEGKCVLLESNYVSGHSIAIDHLPDGVYYIIATDDQRKTYTTEFIKTRGNR